MQREETAYDVNRVVRLYDFPQPPVSGIGDGGFFCARAIGCADTPCASAYALSAYGLFSGYRLRYAFRYALMRMPFRYAQYGTLRYRASCLQSPLAPVRQRLTRSMMSCNTYMTKARKAYDTLLHVCGRPSQGL